jgi:hypothetical protein
VVSLRQRQLKGSLTDAVQLNHGWNAEQQVKFLPLRFCVRPHPLGTVFTSLAGCVRLVAIRVSSVFHPCLKNPSGSDGRGHFILLAVHRNAITTNTKNGDAEVFASTIASGARSHTEEAGDAAI